MSRIAIPAALIAAALGVLYEYVRGSRWGLDGIVLLLAAPVVIWCYRSLPRIVCVVLVATFGIQLVIAPVSLKQSELIECTMLLVFLPALVRFYRERNAGALRVPLLAVTAVLGLAVFDAKYGPQVALKAALPGLQLVLVVTVGLLVGASIDSRESRALLRFLTFVAVVGTAIGLYESSRGAPLYQFTAFQVQGSARAVFRPTAFYGHPTVLGTFNTAIAVANLIQLRLSRWTTRGLVIGVAIPLLGAIITESRSVVVIVALGIVAALLWRGAEDFRGRVPAIATVAAGGAAAYYYISHADSGLLSRFQELSLTEQSVRAHALSNALTYTTGLSRWIGNGPRATDFFFTTVSGPLQLGSLDDQYVTMFADYGVIGLTALLVLALPVLFATVSRSSRAHTAPFICAAVVLLGSMAFFDVLYWPVLGLLFAIGAGAARQRSFAFQSTPVQTADPPVPAVVHR